MAPISAAAPYEPNDAALSAAGPLAFGQTVEAELETASDRDFFYFYATSASASQVTIAIRNLGDGQEAGGINAAIVDSRGMPINPFAYFLAGGMETVATTVLQPQKYFLEIKPAADGGATTSYSFATGGGNGAFGPYSQIAARCARGTAAVKSAQRDVRRAQGKLQRATARLRQSLYGAPAERGAARSSYREAKARVAARQRRLNAARKLLRPWCFIPQ